MSVRACVRSFALSVALRLVLCTGNGEKLIKATSTSIFTLVFAKFANFV